MDVLGNINSSYLILSTGRINEIASILYSKDYQIIPIKEYYKGNFEDSIIAYGYSNDDLRRDAIFLLDHFHEKDAIIKYQGELNAKKIKYDGSELPLDFIPYNTESDRVSYIYEGISFSFKESKRYWKPKSSSDLKIGMIVEYMNNNKWYERKVRNPEDEWEKMYKLLLKYDKLRVSA
jgi:hypothetical protein